MEPSFVAYLHRDRIFFDCSRDHAGHCRRSSTFAVVPSKMEGFCPGACFWALTWAPASLTDVRSGVLCRYCCASRCHCHQSRGKPCPACSCSTPAGLLTSSPLQAGPWKLSSKCVPSVSRAGSLSCLRGGRSPGGCSELAVH